MEEALKKRLQNILLSYLKDIRDEIEIKDKLTRPVKVGGMGFNEEQANQTINILKEKKIQVKTTDEIIKIPQETDFVPPVPKPEEYAQLLWRSKQSVSHSTVVKGRKNKEEKLPAQEVKQEVKQSDKQIDQLVKNKSKLSVKEDKSILSIIKPPKKIVEKKEIKTEDLSVENIEMKPSSAESYGEAMPSSAIRQSPEQKGNQEKTVISQITRPAVNLNDRINDIEQPFRVSNPTNELAELTLIDFRRWSHQLDNQPIKSAERIKQKIDLLGKESLTKRIAGIQAWQRSEIYQLYLTLGKISLEQNKSLTEIIEQRSLQNKPTLSLDEFSALVELNRQMTY